MKPITDLSNTKIAVNEMYEEIREAAIKLGWEQVTKIGYTGRYKYMYFVDNKKMVGDEDFYFFKRATDTEIIYKDGNFYLKEETPSESPIDLKKVSTEDLFNELINRIK